MIGAGLLLKYSCKLEFKLSDTEKSALTTEYREGLPLIHAILQSLFVVRPLLFVALPCCYFPLQILVLDNVVSLDSYMFQDIQIPIFAFVSFAQIMLLILFKFMFKDKKKEMVFIVPRS